MTRVCVYTLFFSTLCKKERDENLYVYDLHTAAISVASPP